MNNPKLNPSVFELELISESEVPVGTIGELKRLKEELINLEKFTFKQLDYFPSMKSVATFENDWIYDPLLELTENQVRDVKFSIQAFKSIYKKIDLIYHSLSRIKVEL